MIQLLHIFHLPALPVICHSYLLSGPIISSVPEEMASNTAPTTCPIISSVPEDDAFDIDSNASEGLGLGIVEPVDADVYSFDDMPPLPDPCDLTLDLLGSDPNNERVKGRSNYVYLLCFW
jgi:hypothetical protein